MHEMFEQRSGVSAAESHQPQQVGSARRRRETKEATARSVHLCCVLALVAPAWSPFTHARVSKQADAHMHTNTRILTVFICK